MSPRLIQLPMSGGDRKHYLRELKIAEQAHARLVAQIEDGYSTVHQLLCQEWNTRQFIGGPAEPSPTLAQAIHGGYVLLEVKCKRCGREKLVDLTLVIWAPGETGAHDGEGAALSGMPEPAEVAAGGAGVVTAAPSAGPGGAG